MQRTTYRSLQAPKSAQAGDHMEVIVLPDGQCSEIDWESVWGTATFLWIAAGLCTSMGVVFLILARLLRPTRPRPR